MTKIPAGWKQELFQLNIAIEYVDWEMDDVALYPRLMDMMQRNEFPEDYKVAMCPAKWEECQNWDCCDSHSTRYLLLGTC